MLGSVLDIVEIMMSKTKSFLLCSLHSNWGKLNIHIYVYIYIYIYIYMYILGK